jgi:membrane fusion protein (multidrug efflux system)
MNATLHPQNRAAIPNAGTRTLGSKRKTMLQCFAALVALIGVSYGVWFYFFKTATVSTENAYTAVETAQVTPLISGPVKEVLVIDTQPVKAGQVLVVLDDANAKIAVNKAAADLAGVRRRVEQAFADDRRLETEIQVRTAEVRAAEAHLKRSKVGLEKAVRDQTRRRKLMASHVISEEEFTDAQTQVDDANAAKVQAEAQVSTALASRAAAQGARQVHAALIAGTTVDSHPMVLAAESALEQAQLDLQRTVLRAPVNGVVAKRAVDVGQQAQVGMPLLSIVPLQQMHVDANFKESQLKDVRVGQDVSLTSDLYGSEVVYRGKVEGFSGGTGSAFATIPAQNATGNWIKVVQRLPIRIALDPQELSQHPLQAGLSMHVTVRLSRNESERHEVTLR